MMGGFVRVKTGVSFAVIAPAGFRLLGAIERTARRLNLDLVITCGCEAHDPLDPHTLGEAYDVRTHDLPDDAAKRTLLKELMIELIDDENQFDSPVPASHGLATRQFFGWIEHPHEVNEHLHVQRRHGLTYGKDA